MKYLLTQGITNQGDLVTENPKDFSFLIKVTVSFFNRGTFSDLQNIQAIIICCNISSVFSINCDFCFMLSPGLYTYSLNPQSK